MRSQSARATGADACRTWRLGSRGSPLALAQAEEVRRRMATAHGVAPERIEIVPIRTTGDRVRDRPLAEIGGKGLFAKELDAALLAREIDFAAHSAKDLPGDGTDGVEIAAVPPRADPADCLAARADVEALGALPVGATVGTSSPRRRAQLLRARPDLRIVPLRGNVGTRLQAVRDGSVDATLLAAAGLARLGFRDRRVRRIDPFDSLPAVGQGAIAITVRTEDERARRFAAKAGDDGALAELAAERAVLGGLGGDCHSPIAALARQFEGEVALFAEILSLDGARRLCASARGPREDCARLGAEVAAGLRARAGPGFWDG